MQTNINYGQVYMKKGKNVELSKKKQQLHVLNLLAYLQSWWWYGQKLVKITLIS